jgi:hypothetical protein
MKYTYSSYCFLRLNDDNCQKPAPKSHNFISNTLSSINRRFKEETMMTNSKALLKSPIVFLGLALFNATPAHALLITQSEAHASNFQIVATGRLTWNSWSNIAAAGAFDDPSGWSQAYDPGANGQASATATTAYASAQGTASSNLLKIDVFGNLNNTTNNVYALNAYAYGELYNTFQVSGNSPVQATFSLDWNAKLSGQSSPGQGYYYDTPHISDHDLR